MYKGQCALTVVCSGVSVLHCFQAPLPFLIPLKSMAPSLFCSFVVAIALALSVTAFNNTVYIISNAETPSLQLPGLTPIGLQRVQDCLPALLAPLDIGIVVSCPFDPESGACLATLATANPLATSLGLTVNTSCGADEETDDDCVTDLLKTFSKTSTQAMLVIWDLDQMDSLFENLDIDDDDDDDDDADVDGDDDDDATPHFDVLTTIVKSKVTSVVSQNCAGIDGQAVGTFRRSFQRGLKKRKINSRIARRHHARRH
ncbi:hypothetical protein B0H34DRAFT_737105 [Crassisporium funariophilum]|nr:hypothetical protein B0H34DRAFT_737105 [Crassisporium funariophilum]